MQKGKRPPQPGVLAGVHANGVIPTYGSDTIITRPGAVDDREILKTTNKEVMDIIFAADNLSGDERDDSIISQLKELG